MSVIAIGLNHTTAPLDMRARFALPGAALRPMLLQFLQRVRGASETAMLSTCNRTEIYVAAEEPVVEPASAWLAELGGTDLSTFGRHAYVLTEADAARHAFRVASGLDSMVLGEPQVLGQMKEAVRQANEAGTLGSTLHQMFQRGFAVAKEVRTRTEIGTHSISMAAACVRAASRLFEDIAETRVVCVGAGEMMQLVAQHLAAHRPREMHFANRTLDRADALASRFGGRSMLLADLPDRLSQFDIVISSTASSVPIIGLGAVERALKARRRRPMFIADLAVPRDVEAEVGQLPDAYLYNIDDLAAWVRIGSDKRQAAVEHAEAIVESGVHGFIDWLGQRDLVPLIQALRGRADDWQRVELARARRRLGQGQCVDSVLDAMAQALTQKFLHGALGELRSCQPSGRAELAETLTKVLLGSARAGQEAR